MVKKKSKPLSQAEIWDDSALLQSWDEALAEYQKYHSIHARGENVEDVIKAAEQSSAALQPAGIVSDSDMHGGESADMEVLEDGEVEETSNSVNNEYDDAAPKNEELEADSAEQSHLPSTGVAIPTAVTVNEEALKNLMMSWYYAGYHTGYYEGQQSVKQKP